jgi:uncharacterized OB-fold protein
MGGAGTSLLTSARVLDRRRMEIAADGSLRLLGIRCLSCGTLSHPVRRRCPACGGPADSTPLAPDGRVIVATMARTARSELLIHPPYQVVLARLADGPTLKLPSLEPAAFQPGDALTVAALVLESDDGPVAALQARHATSPHD